MQQGSEPVASDTMTKTIHIMYSLAYRKAIALGPRILDVNGNPRAAYHLTKDELKKLFTLNGFNTERVTWLKYIIAWKETWEEVAPSPARILDPNDDDWSVIFAHPNVTELSELRKFGEASDIQIVAVAE